MKIYSTENSEEPRNTATSVDSQRLSPQQKEQQTRNKPVTLTIKLASEVN
jgi:hypothetical protein